MTRLSYLVPVTLLLWAAAAGPDALADGEDGLPAGEEIMAKVNGRERGGSARMSLRLTLTDPKRGEFTKRIEAERRKEASGFRTIYRITQPDHEEGIVLLVAEEPELDGFWMYFPRSDHLLGVATRGLSALGSDFSCEDLRWLFPSDEYEFRTLERVTIDGDPGYRVEMKPASDRLRRELGFERAVGWVRERDWVVVRSEYHDDSGRVFKTFRAERIERVQGVPTVLESTMVNHRIEHTSRVEVVSVEYGPDPPPDEARFEPEGLAAVSRGSAGSP